MNRNATSIVFASAILLCSLSASAKDSETITTKETIVPSEHQTTTTTTIPDNPVLIREPDGSTMVAQPTGSTTVQTDTIEETPIVEKTVVVKKKKSQHHLLNLFGIKVL